MTLYRALSVGVVVMASALIWGIGPASAQSAGPNQCSNPGIVMLATSWCGHCRRARNFFRENNIDFDEIDVERAESESIKSTAKKFGIPFIVVGGEEVRGFNERKLRDLLCLPG